MEKNQKGLARLATTKGFTIIELIVVIAIIAILAAIVITNVSTYINKAKGTAFRAAANEFIKAVKLKKADTNSLPTGMIYRRNPEIPPWDNNNTYKTAFTSNFGNYIADFPKPPFAGYFYYYYYYNISSPDNGQCNGSPYMILIYGTENQNFFSDWPTWPSSPSYRCFPLI